MEVSNGIRIVDAKSGRQIRLLKAMLVIGLLVIITTGCHRTILDETSEEVGLHPSLRLNDEGLPVIAYFDKRSRALKLLTCNDPRCSDPEVIFVDQEGAVGQYPSLAFGPEGMPIISYYDMTGRALKFARCRDPLCSEVDRVIVDEGGKKGEYSSLTLNRQGRPVMSYYDGENRNLMLAICQDLQCGDVSTIVLDDMEKVGKYTSLAITSDNRPVVSYYDDDNADLRVAICQDPKCADVVKKTLDGGGVDAGDGTSLALSSEDYPIVSYQYYDSESDPSIGALKIVLCQDAVCETAIYGMLYQRKGDRTGEYNSMVLNSDGLPVVGFWDSAGHKIRIATCKDAGCVRSRLRSVTFDWGAKDVSVDLNDNDKLFFSCYEVRPSRNRLLLYRPLMP